jgi:hypothetical protein
VLATERQHLGDNIKASLLLQLTLLAKRGGAVVAASPDARPAAAPAFLVLVAAAAG